MKFRTLFSGEQLPVLGFGTWRLGGIKHPDTSQDARIVDTIRFAIDVGYTHIDTAEMYGAGHTEELVGLAIRGYDRQKIQICSKIWHTNLRFNDV